MWFVWSQQEKKTQKLLVLANLCLWSYFWIAFALASYPFRVDPLGHPAGAGYTFWGHSIAVVESAFTYPFFRAVFWADFPSFVLANLIVRLFSPHLDVLNRFWGGISGAGWQLLGVMVLSFFQWYLVGGAVQKLGRKWFGHSTGIRNQPSSTGPMPPDATASHS
jgi:hypothetical protein